jgi:hypothetical protein
LIEPDYIPPEAFFAKPPQFKQLTAAVFPALQRNGWQAEPMTVHFRVKFQAKSSGREVRQTTLDDCNRGMTNLVAVAL